MRIASSPRLKKSVLGSITKPENGAIILVVALLFVYCLLPLSLFFSEEAGDYFGELAVISMVAAGGVFLGSRLSLFCPLICGRIPRIGFSLNIFIVLVWIVFIVFMFIAWVTAERIPLLAALSGADPDTIALLREQFLKAREGWQASFVYINGVLTGVLIPYVIALMFLWRMRTRFIAFGVFLIFCISFVEKAFFLKAVIPLLVLLAQRRISMPVSPKGMLILIFGLLGFVTVLSGAGSVDSTNNAAFFSANYVPQGPVAHLVWRSVAIPVVTAADALRVFHEDFQGHEILGATSTLIASLTGMERIEFERLVFAAQWGQNETGTGSANSAFFIEAYVNFGWFGIVIFSIVVGQIMRLFAKSKDNAFRSLWPLFALGVFTSGLIGFLFSNGLIILILMALFVRFKNQYKL